MHRITRLRRVQAALPDAVPDLFGLEELLDHRYNLIGLDQVKVAAKSKKRGVENGQEYEQIEADAETITT